MRTISGSYADFPKKPNITLRYKILSELLCAIDIGRFMLKCASIDHTAA